MPMKKYVVTFQADLSDDDHTKMLAYVVKDRIEAIASEIKNVVVLMEADIPSNTRVFTPAPKPESQKKGRR